MGIFAIEQFDKRRSTRNGSRRQKERTFTVYTTPPTPAFNTEQSLQLLAGWPGIAVSLGTAHPEDGEFFAVNYDAQQRSGTRSVFDIRWIYEPVGVGGPGGENENEPGFVDVNLTTSIEFVDFYRKDAAVDSMLWPPLIVPQNGNAPEIPLGESQLQLYDVQGMSIDEGGRPVSHELRSVEYEVTHVIEQPSYNYLETIVFLTGTRNSEPYVLMPQLADVGRLLYLGADSQRISDNVYRFTHRFVADEFYHMRQICAFNEEGDPILTTFAPDGSGPQQARYVWWVQPFTRTASFSFLDIPL